MIELEHLTKTFRIPGKAPLKALDDVSLTIEKGEIFGIIGYSGAGKSTLVRMINLLERPDLGRVTVDGVQLTELSGAALRRERQKIGMIFQHFNLMPSRTVFENVALPLTKTSLTPAEKKARIEELLSLVGLADRGSAYPSQLSGGQKQRVAIARALACNPKVLLCDEATSALDPQTTRQILALLKKLNEKLGLTIVLITHQMSVVKSICRRVAVMEKGRVAESGSVFEVFSRPSSDAANSLLAEALNLDEVLGLINAEEHGELAHKIASGAQLCALTYAGKVAEEPLMVRAFEKFGVVANILFGSIELLQGQPLGRLGVLLEGGAESVEEAIGYLRAEGVLVEPFDSKAVQAQLCARPAGEQSDEP